MKFLFVVFAVTGNCMLGHAQYYASTHKVVSTEVSPIIQPAAQFQLANPPGLKMRNTGRTLTIIGSVLLVGGIIMTASADELYYETGYSSSGNYSEGDPQAAFGILMIAGGTGMVIPGIIFWSKGSKRYKAHLAEQGASLGLKGTGLALCYRF